MRTWRGWSPDRAAQLTFIPQEPNFVGSGLPHVGPWDYVEDVPMLWYGPGFVPAGVSVDRPVTVAGIAPTVAKLLHFDGFDAIDGQPMNEARRGHGRAPKLVVTMVWDAGGMNVLDEWPDAHPYLDALIAEGHVVRGRERRLVADQHRADPRDDRHRRVPEPQRDRRAPPASSATD